MATELRRRPITVDEYHRMLEVGILRSGERVELLRGDLVQKLSIGDQHRACVGRLHEMLILRLYQRAFVQAQNPVVVLDDSEPEPDIALLERNEASVGGNRHVYPRDVFALVEVTDTSRARDLRFKRALYAEAGIREYWVVDLIDDVVHIHRNPNPAAKRYRTTTIARRGESHAFEAFPDDRFDVAEILGPDEAR